MGIFRRAVCKLKHYIKKPLRRGGMAPLYCLPNKNYSLIATESVETAVVSRLTMVSVGFTGGFPKVGSTTVVSELVPVESELPSPSLALLQATNPKELIENKINNFFIQKKVCALK